MYYIKSKHLVLTLLIFFANSIWAKNSLTEVEDYILQGKGDSALIALNHLKSSSINMGYGEVLASLASDPQSKNYKEQYRFVTNVLSDHTSEQVLPFVKRSLNSPLVEDGYNFHFFKTYWWLMLYARNEGGLDVANKIYDELTIYLERSRASQSKKQRKQAKLHLATHEAVIALIAGEFEKGEKICIDMETVAREINDTALIISSLYYRCDFLQVKGDLQGYISLSEECYRLNSQLIQDSDYGVSIKTNLINAYIYSKTEPGRVERLLEELYTKKVSRKETYILYTQSLGLTRPSSSERLQIFKKFGVDNIESFCDAIWSLGKSQLDLISQRNLLMEIGVQLSEVKDYKNALKYERELRQVSKEVYTEELITSISQLTAELDLKKSEIELEKLSNKSRNQKSVLFAILSTLVLLLGFLYFKYLLEKKQQELVRKSNVKLEKLNEVKNTFFNNISRELRTPLTLISSPLQEVLSLENQSYSNEVKKHIELANDVAVRLNDKVEEFLKLSSTENNRIDINPERFQVNALLTEITSPFIIQASFKDVQLEIKTTLSEEHSHCLDREHFQTILDNLLSNAIKHSPSGGTVLLSSKMRGSNLLIQVVDHGPGINSNEINKIFSPHYQTELGEKAGGFGIGLSLSKQLAILMDGELYFHSVPGKHTTFDLELPPLNLADDLVNETISVSKFGERISDTNFGSRFNLLIVDNHPEMVKYLESVLIKEFKVHKAFTYDEALDVLESNTIDIIITDLMLVGANDEELVQSLKKGEKWRKVPVVIVSAKNSLEEKLELFNLGIADYITKPFNAAELKARLLNIVVRSNEKDQSGLEKSNFKDSDEIWLKDVKAFIESKISDHNLRIPEVAEHMGMTERTLRRKLNALTGVSPNSFIKEMRLSYARNLLLNNAYGSVKEVAYACGFSRADFFAKEFQKHYGQLPNKLLS
ncbi:MAG: hypothetical protein COA58_13815 [Bacteroidetes bacterium]|nr:MAG: hypothetical protein COA58_13815 [Bacteroidota bacterium]